MKCKKCGTNTQYGQEHCEKCMDEMIEEEKQLAGVKPQSRKTTLMAFYYRMKKQLEDNDFDFILFCQCYATLTEKEGYDLTSIYLTDFNNALIRYRNSKTYFRIDKKAKGKDKRMLETFGELMKEQLGWQEVR